MAGKCGLFVLGGTSNLYQTAVKSLFIDGMQVSMLLYRKVHTVIFMDRFY